MALNQNRKTNAPRGAVLIVALVFVAILMAICANFGLRVRDTNQGMEYEIASARALELAQAANMKNLQQLWADYVARSQTLPNPMDRVVWLGVTTSDANGNRKRNGGEPPPYADDAKFNQAYAIFGQGEAQTSCKVYGAVPDDNSYVDLELVATARLSSDIMWRSGTEKDKTSWAYRTVRLLVRFNFTQPSRVFDFAYFANNFGWMYDNGSSAIKVFGGIGSNGDLAFQGRPWVDGTMFAALNPAINAQGVINGASNVVSQNLTAYRSYVNGLATGEKGMMTPTNPGYTEDINGNGVLNAGEDKNGNGKIDATEYVPGYSGTAQQFTKQTPLDMPFLGDLTWYKDAAQAQGGSIKQLKLGGDPTKEADWETVVAGVYGDTSGEDGLYSTVNVSTGAVTRTSVPADKQLVTDNTKHERNGNMALIGTDAQPLKITGPVVITNDLVLKGKITGQGTIYTGRNLHVVGDVTYVDPPVWQQNDPNFDATLTANNGKDMVGFATKGSVILGQYYRMQRSDKTPVNGQKYDDGDGWSTARNYFKTGFQNNQVQAYQTDPSDQVIGYYDPVTKRFAGDYTANDGGVRYDKTDFTATVSRKYYESSFADDYISSIATGRPSKLDGIFYTNHLFGGRPQDLKLRGSMVSRDEGIIFTNTCYFYYDPRSSSNTVGSRVRVFLPSAPGYNVWLWQELPNQ